MKIIRFFKKHKLIFGFLVFICVLLVALFSYSLFISFQINGIIDDAMNFKPYSEYHSKYIDKQEYESLYPLLLEDYQELQVNDSMRIIKNQHTFPWFVPFSDGVSYNYTYEAVDNSRDFLMGEDEIKVTVYTDHSQFPIHISGVKKHYFE